MAADLATDLLILTFPTVILWNVRIPLAKKLALAAIFSVTIILMNFLVVRVVLVKGTVTHLQHAGID